MMLSFIGPKGSGKTLAALFTLEEFRNSVQHLPDYPELELPVSWRREKHLDNYQHADLLFHKGELSLYDFHRCILDGVELWCTKLERDSPYRNDDIIVETPPTLRVEMALLNQTEEVISAHLSEDLRRRARHLAEKYKLPLLDTFDYVTCDLDKTSLSDILDMEAEWDTVLLITPPESCLAAIQERGLSYEESITLEMCQAEAELYDDFVRARGRRVEENVKPPNEEEE
jgi:hypothetical protein